MKIIKVDGEAIRFDNGNSITYEHYQDCCEYNYADLEQLDDLARDTEFDEPLEYEAVEESGFRFGNKNGKMFFIPCYSEQNGYYSDDIEIHYDGEKVLHFTADFRCE